MTEVIIGGGTAGVICMEQVRVPEQPSVSVAVITKSNMPSADGVPWIHPPEDRSNPGGKEPPVKANKYGEEPPDAVISTEYPSSTLPLGKWELDKTIVGQETGETMSE
jgi:hypothetical protein